MFLLVCYRLVRLGYTTNGAYVTESIFGKRFNNEDDNDDDGGDGDNDDVIAQIVSYLMYVCMLRETVTGK